jgi:signal transduction histidine kinase
MIPRIKKLTERKLSLRTELSFYFAMIGLLAISTISIVVNFFLEEQFKAYAIQKQQKRNHEVVELISSQYRGEGNWKTDVIQSIGVNLLEEGLIIKQTDKSGQIIWNALEYNSGICHTMINHMTERMADKYPSVDGGFTQETYPLFYQNIPIGALEIGYYGPFYFTDTEFYFIETINYILLWIALGTLGLAILFGLLFSGKLSKPLTEVVKTASDLANGQYTNTRNIRSSVKEVSLLIQAINTLSANLHKQETLRKQLTADVAHELRTPLTTLQGHVEAMLDGIWDISHHRLENCHEEIVRIKHIVNDLETLARYDAESMQLEKTHFNMQELINHAVSLNEAHFKSKEMSIRARCDEVYVWADRDKLTQVLGNLLTNTFNYCSPACEVKIEVKNLAGKIELVITDNGPGIPAADLPYIFERFYRVDKSRTRKTGGSGIGLAIVKEIVKAHKGSIDVQSREGYGTEFKITIPLLEPLPALPPPL